MTRNLTLRRSRICIAAYIVVNLAVVKDTNNDRSTTTSTMSCILSWNFVLAAMIHCYLLWSAVVLITYELLDQVFERSSNIISLFKELENIRIDAWFLSRKDGVKLKYRRGA
jgi:hypothetical protein